ncbi:hypothetical protein C0991_011292 [Blastosporella zonata]|nr:hypothetical protein C0991_011292 [Blastosporella zonata]
MSLLRRCTKPKIPQIFARRSMSVRPREDQETPKEARKKVTIQSLQTQRRNKIPITMLTAYDYPTGLACSSNQNLDITLVGDSLAQVCLGHNSTTELTLTEMIHHARAVSRGTTHPLLVADMPFGTYHVSPFSATENAIRLIQEGRVEAVKLEGGSEMLNVVRQLTSIGIPVMAHVGLMPQRHIAMSGYKVQGRNAEDARRVLNDALALEDAGAFSIVIEAVPKELGSYITQRLSIPTIGIGAGPGTSGQVLVWDDAMGTWPGHKAKFVRRFADLQTPRDHGISGYTSAVRGGLFPADTESYTMDKEEWERLRRGDAHPIYPEIATPQEERAMVVETLVNGLSRMDKDSKAVSVETAEKKLKTFTKTLDDHGENIVVSLIDHFCLTIFSVQVQLGLLQAVKDFKDRIIPVFKKAEEQSREIETLKSQLETCQAELAISVSSIGLAEKKRDQASSALHQTTIERDTAIELADKAAQKTVQLRLDLTRAQQQGADLEESKSLYKKQLLEHQEVERKQNEKIRSLRQRLANAQQEIETERTARKLEVDLDSGTLSTQRPSKRRATSPPRPSDLKNLISSTITNTKPAFFEGMPPPRFETDWNLRKPDGKKQKLSVSDSSKQSFPIKLERGRPVGSVQIGTRTRIRA